MLLEENKKLVRRYFEAFNNRDIPSLLAVCDENIVEHPAPHGLPSGIEGIKQHKEKFFAAFTDVNIILDDVFAEADKVALRFTLHATNAQTGKRLIAQLMGLGRVADGKLVEMWQGTIEEKEE